LVNQVLKAERLAEEIEKNKKDMINDLKQRVEGSGKWKHVNVATEEITYEDKAIFAKLSTEFLSRPVKRNKKSRGSNKRKKLNLSDSDSRSGFPESKGSRRQTSFNISGIIQSKKFAKKLKTKAQNKTHQPTPSETHLPQTPQK